MDNITSQILKLYTEFEEVFTKDNFPHVFQVIESYNESLSGQAHRYGNYARLYTPATYKPKIMIVGSNPSWFDKDSAYKAQQIVKSLMKGPPAKSSYIEHSYNLALKFQSAFTDIGRIDLLESAVGMNRLWLQTGPSMSGWTKSLNSRSDTLNQSFADYCGVQTLKIIKLIDPQVLMLVGAKVQQLDILDLLNTDIEVENVSYPFGGGMTAFRRELKSIVKKHSL